MTIFRRKVRHILPRQDVYFSLTAKFLHIHILEQNFEFSMSLNFTCSVLVKFSPLLGDHWLEEEAGDSDVLARGRTRGRLNNRLED